VVLCGSSYVCAFARTTLRGSGVAASWCVFVWWTERTLIVEHRSVRPCCEREIHRFASCAPPPLRWGGGTTAEKQCTDSPPCSNSTACPAWKSNTVIIIRTPDQVHIVQGGAYGAPVFTECYSKSK
ncbi:unnamed protein product, partial [Ectocarpus sp. 12 AP-2014]